VSEVPSQDFLEQERKRDEERKREEEVEKKQKELRDKNRPKFWWENNLLGNEQSANTSSKGSEPTVNTNLQSESTINPIKKEEQKPLNLKVDNVSTGNVSQSNSNQPETKSNQTQTDFIFTNPTRSQSNQNVTNQLPSTQSNQTQTPDVISNANISDKKSDNNEMLLSSLRVIDDFEKGVVADLDYRNLLFLLNTVALNTMDLLEKLNDSSAKSKFARGTDSFIRLAIFIMNKVGSKDKEFIKICRTIATTASTIVEQNESSLYEKFNSLIRGCLHNILDLTKQSQVVRTRSDDLFDLVKIMRETISIFRDKIENNDPVDSIVEHLKTFLRHTKEVQYYQDIHPGVQVLLFESSQLGKLFVQAYQETPTEEEQNKLKKLTLRILECIENLK